MDDRLARLVWPALYAGVALAVAGPLLAPGYVFALDHAMGPESATFYATSIAHNADPIQSKGGYAVLLGALDALLPMWLAQKLILFLPFFLAGWGAHRMSEGRVGAPAAVFAGLLYALSPFAYLRGVSGQTGVLWAYALAPWFLRAWLTYADTGGRRALAVASLLVTATLVFQAHGAILLAILVAMHTLVRLVRAPRSWWPTLRAPIALAGWAIALNLYWLVPVLLAQETTLSGIGSADRAFFATTAAGLPSVGLAAITLQGFWREAYASPYAWRGLLAFPAFVLLLSARALFDKRDDASRAVALAGLLGLALAIGQASRWTAWLSDALWDHVPFMRGFRDAHKLLALLALAFAYLAPVGFEALLSTVSRWRAARLPPRGVARALTTAFVALLVVSPLAAAGPLLGGYHGQLGVAEYPQEWHAVEAVTRECEGPMVVLPWHLYADLSWIPNADKRVTGPAKLFFSCPTVTSDDLELGGAASQASSPTGRFVSHWVGGDALARGNVTRLGNLLSPVGAQYVLLLKESDWTRTAPLLDAQEDLRLVLENDRARLYESVAARAAALHEVEEVVVIESWDALAPLSRESSLARLAFVEALPETAPSNALVAYRPPSRTPQTEWTLAERAPVAMSLGFQPVFAAGGAEEMTEERVRDMGAVTGAYAWAASWAAVVALGVVVWKGARQRRTGA